ncbi:MAG: MlaD family protein [Candidatus Omnitrophica bacterium]|nr:MlaD family protein [Candidatus Omnitrophota bacterium]
MKNISSSLQFKVGLFIFLGLIIFFVFVFSQGKILRGKGYELKVVYNYVGGLDPGAPVRVSGFRVGEVKDIELSMEQDHPRVIVTIRIRPDIRLGRHSRFMVRNYGIIGEKYLEILSTGLKDVPLIEPGEFVQGEDPLPMERFLSAGEDILRNLNSLLVSLNNITSDETLKGEIKNIVSSTDDVLKKASRTLDSFNQFASSLNRTSEAINVTIAEIKPDLKKIVSNAGDSVLEINQILAKNSESINHIVSSLEKSTTELERTLPEISNRMKNAGDTFATTGERINDFIEKIESSSLFAELITDTEIAREIKDTIISLKQTSRNINNAFLKIDYASDQVSAVLSDIRSGKGTVGKLVMGDELYNQIFDMVQDLKAHPWKIFFRGKEK